MFSPYYAQARRTGGGVANPEEHCSLNVALSGAGGHRWAMTERDHASVQRSRTDLTIGPSNVSWNGRALVIDIDETTAPIPSRLKGRITLHPVALTQTDVALDVAGRHRWRPLAPLSRIEVRMENPALSWNGIAYLDSNTGSAPLENDFANWSWSRTIEDGRTRVFYDVVRKAGDTASLAIEFDAKGQTRTFEAPPPANLPKSLWRMQRATRATTPADVRVLDTWEDGPFYARSLIETDIDGARVRAVHESLSLDRFKTRIVQAMLPFRMPRRHHAPRPPQ